MLRSSSQHPVMLIRPRNTDKRVLEQALGHYYGLHVAAALPDFMTRFVRDLGKPVIIDPMAYVFALRPKQLLRPNNRTLRLSLKTLSAEYGPLIEAYAGTRALTPTDLLGDLNKLKTFTVKVLDYQRKKLHGQLSLINPYYDKYNLWETQEGERIEIAASVASPEVLIPPYFSFKEPGDGWYTTTLECAKEALSIREPGQPVFPTLLFTSDLLESTNLIDRIAGDFGQQGFDGFFIWLNDFKEDAEGINRIKGLVRLVKKLSQGGRPVYKLYGGYLSVLFFAYGLKGFSCGLGYGMSKNVYAFGTGGRQPSPKFYIPALHRSLELGDAERLLRAYPNLRCSCKICKTTYGEDINCFADMRSRGLCEAHFLNARRLELKDIAEKGINHCVGTLKETVAEFKSNLLVDVSALETWMRVIEEYPP